MPGRGSHSTFARGLANRPPVDAVRSPRTPSSATTAGASGVLKRIGGGTVTYALAPNAFVVAGGELTLEDYVGIDRNVTTTSLKAGLGYKLNRSVELGLDGEHKIVRSSEAGGDYTDSSVTATLTLRQ